VGNQVPHIISSDAKAAENAKQAALMA